MMGKHEIVVRNRDAPQRHGDVLPAPAHPESEGELEIVKQIDLSTPCQVKAEEPGIPGKARGYPAHINRIQLCSGVGK